MDGDEDAIDYNDDDQKTKTSHLILIVLKYDDDRRWWETEVESYDSELNKNYSRWWFGWCWGVVEEDDDDWRIESND